MKKTIQKSVLAMGLIALLSPLTAKAEPSLSQNHTQRFSIVGLADFYSPSVDSSNTSFSSLTNSSKAGWGLGILSEGAISNTPLGIEVGLLYTRRQNEYKTGAFSYTQASNWLTLPVAAKFRFLDFFSVGAGPYISYRIGDISNDFSAGSAASINFDTTQQNRFEFGVFASAGVTLPVAENAGILLEARYMKGISNLSEDNSTNIKSADVVAMAGFQFQY